MTAPLSGTGTELDAILRDAEKDCQGHAELGEVLLRWRDAAVAAEREGRWSEHQTLAGRIDQIVGHAKAAKTEDYYLMAVENVAPMRDHLLSAIAGCGYHAPTACPPSAGPLTKSERDLIFLLIDYANGAIGRLDCEELRAKLQAVI